MKPRRIQRRRVKGWKMPSDTIIVTRPSKWGNPYKVGEKYISNKGLIEIKTAQQAVNMYKQSVLGIYECPVNKKQIKKELKGKNLACFCPLDTPCHADFLLEIANE